MDASPLDANVGSADRRKSRKSRSRRAATERSAEGAKRSGGRRKTRGAASKNVRREGENESSADNPKTVCKPLSVCLTRLPEAAVNETAASSTKTLAKKKNRRIPRWKNGICHRSIRHRRQAMMRTRALRMNASRIKVSQVAGDDTVEEAAVPVSESASIVVESVNEGTGSRAASQQGRVDEPEGIPEKIESGSGIGEGTVVGVSENPKVEGTARSAEKLGGAELSQEPEARLDETDDAVENTLLVGNECSIAEGVYDRNCDKLLERTEEAPNKVETFGRISRKAAKRKRTSEGGGSNKRQRSARRTKKLECSTSSAHTQSVSAPEAGDSGSNDNSATPEPQDSLATSKTDSSKCVRDRRKSNEIHLSKNAVVFVTRLNDLRSPLVKKWRNRVAAGLQSCTGSVRECSPNEHHMDNENAVDSCAGDNSSERIVACPIPVTAEPASPRSERDTPNGIVMCDSNEDDSDEDDDEIIAFLSARSKARQLIESSHSEDESNDLAYRKIRLSRNSSSDMSLIRSEYDSRSDVEQIEGQSPPSTQSVASVDDPPGSVTSSRCVESEGPDWSHSDTNWEDESSHEANVTAPPLTRGRLRATLENASYEDSLIASDVPKERCKRDFRLPVSSSNCENSSDKMANDECNETETRVIDSCAENPRDVVEREPNEKNDASPVAVADFSAYSPLDRIRLNRDDRNEDRAARQKLAAMKNAMVVLTRLEDLSELAENDDYTMDEIACRFTYEMEFSSDLCQEIVKEDVSNYDNDYDIDLHSDETRLSSRSAADPLELDRTLVDRSRTPVGTSDACLLAVASPEESPRRSGPSAIGNDGTVGHPEVGRSPRRATESVGSRVRKYGVSRGQNESDDEGQLSVDEAVSQETVESDVELTLVFDEGEPESSDDGSGRGKAAPIDANGINDETMRGPNVESSESFHRGESHRDDRLLNEPELLEQRRASSEFRNAGSPDKVSQTTFATPLPQSSQNGAIPAEKRPRKGRSDDQSPNEDTPTGLESADPITVIASTKDKKQKQSAQKNISKKSRLRPRCRVDNLTCNVCSTNFETKTALSEHLYKHSSVELQEAFRIAKAKAMATAQAENAARKKKASSKSKDVDPVDGEANDDATIEASGDDDPARNSDASEAPTGESITGPIAAAPLTNDSSTSDLATVCLCHRDNDQTPLDNIDLQIEMVLLCKYCHVLFRRRECLEIHYRTSAHCAIDRTRERWPRLFCANCQLILNNWADMRQHLEVHARQNAECAIRFVCNICRVVFVGFGTLFYNHWISHSKDSMFVAGRYNFPKFSVQPIDGTEKLPAGARPDENYIFVAEHVCTICKKPFSMRRDLEAHQQTHCRRKPQQQRRTSGVQTDDIANSSTVSTPWCDVCYKLFANEKAMNDHATSEHGDRYVYATAGTQAGDKIFKCTECATFASSVKAIDEHWESSMHERRPAATLASDPSTTVDSSTAESIVARPDVTSSLDDAEDRNRSSGGTANSVTGHDENSTTESPPLITIVEDDNVRLDYNRENERTTKSPSVPANNGNIVISIPPNTGVASDVISRIEQLPILRGVLIRPLAALARNAAERQTSKTRALEDPSVNVVVSDTRGANLSASLVLNDAREKTKNRAIDGNTDSYEIFLTDQSSMCSVTTVRNNSTSTKDTPEISASSAMPPSIANDRIEQDKTMIGNTSDPVGSLTREPSSTETAESSVPATTAGCSSDQDRRRPVPEIIDIVDDDGEVTTANPVISPNGRKFTPSPNHQNSIDSTLTKKRNGRSLREFRKVNVGQCNTRGNSTTVDSTAPRPVGGKGKSPEHGSSSETSSITGRNASGPCGRQRLNPTASQASAMSYEEERWNWLRTTSGNPNAGGSNGTRKQGFLRVKDLSELQAVRTHACSLCNASFESVEELGEHRLSHVGGESLSRSNVPYPTGMSAALSLPEAPECPNIPTQSGPIVAENASGALPGMRAPTQTWSYVPQRVFDSLANQQNSPMGRFPNTVVTNDPPVPWLPVGSKNTLVAPSCAASTQPGFATGTNGQTPLSGFRIVETIDARTGSGQIRNSAIGQQPLLVSSVRPVELPDTSQRLPENRTAASGYHVLPPMVVLPSCQSGKTPSAVANQRTASNNVLPDFCLNNSPLTFRPDKRNKFLCNICRTFECDNIDAFNYHVTKHYTGWKNTHAVTSNSLQPSPVAMISATTVTMPALAPLEMRAETSQHAPPKTTQANAIGNSPSLNNWTVKNTPQGPLLVTPVSATTDPWTLSNFVENNNRSILRQTPLNSDNPNASSKHSVQIVLRCMICKSALYKNYPPLRNHVILVHGVTDFSLLGLDNIAQKSYHCTQCPNTTALFDCEKKYREHVDTVHTHPCPSCRRVFSNFLALRHHLEQCRVATSNDRNAYGKNC